MRKPMLLMVLIFIVPIVSALTINNTLLEATTANITINITHQWNLSEAVIAPSSIKVINLSYSHPSSVLQDNNTITFNMTKANQNYNGTQMPYFSHISNFRKTIISNLNESVDGELFMSTDSCGVVDIKYRPSNTTNNKDYNSTEYTCSNNIINLTYTGLSEGTNNFYINNFLIENCTAGNITMRFDIFDEDSPTTSLNADSKVEVLYWRSPSMLSNFTLAFDNLNNFSLCLNPQNMSINVDIYVQYNTTAFTHRYYLYNETLNSTQQNVTMYNHDDSTGISDLVITTRHDSNYSYYPNVVAKLQRKYVDEGVWRTIQMDRSGDYGTVFFNVYEENTDYKLIFQDTDNNILRTTKDMKFVCDSAICELTFLLEPYTLATAVSEVQVTHSYSSSTKNLTTNWIDLSGESNNVRTVLTRHVFNETFDICDTTQTGASGSTVCDASGYTGLAHYKVYDDGDMVVSEWIELNSTKLGYLIGDNEGGFWVVGIVVTSVMFGVFSPAAAIITMVIGLIATYLLGIFTPITMTFIITSAVAGIVIGLKVRQ